MCVCAPLSDQDPNEYVVPATVCGDVAVMEFCEPMMTVRWNVVVDAVALTARDRPLGTDWNVRTTVCGSSRRVTDAVVPKLSVAVSVSSRYDGYSWSGALNDPEAT